MSELLYLACIADFEPAVLDALADRLPPQRRARADACRLPTARAASILGYHLTALGARRLLSDPCLGDFLLDENGKPSLPDPRVSFSISHSDGAVAVLISSRAIPVGVDLEPIRALSPRLAEAIASPSERESLLRPDGAIGLWVRKEAAAKASGGGVFPHSLRGIDCEASHARELTVGGCAHLLAVCPAELGVLPVTRIFPSDLENDI